MNRRLSKKINNKALEVSVVWLKSMLSDSEAAKVNSKHIPIDNPFTFKDGTAFSIPYSYRGAKAIIKKILKRKQLPLDIITIHDIEEATKGTPRS